MLRGRAAPLKVYLASASTQKVDAFDLRRVRVADLTTPSPFCFLPAAIAQSLAAPRSAHTPQAINWALPTPRLPPPPPPDHHTPHQPTPYSSLSSFPHNLTTWERPSLCANASPSVSIVAVFRLTILVVISPTQTPPGQTAPVQRPSFLTSYIQTLLDLLTH